MRAGGRAQLEHAKDSSIGYPQPNHGDTDCLRGECRYPRTKMPCYAAEYECQRQRVEQNRSGFFSSAPDVVVGGSQEQTPDNHGQKYSDGAEVQIAFRQEEERPIFITDVIVSIEPLHIPILKTERPVGENVRRYQ